MNNTDFMFGINEKAFPYLCNEIDALYEKIYEVFNKIDNDIEELTQYYDSTDGTEYVNKYKDFRKNYSIIRANLESYSKDLETLVEKIKSGTRVGVIKFNDYAENWNSKSKAIDRRE